MPTDAPVVMPKAKKLRGLSDPTGLLTSKAGRVLAAIRRDMDGKEALFRNRKRNEEVLALAYQDGTMPGGAGEVENLRTNALNLPFRYVRWVEARATSKKLVVKVSRDAGEGQRPSGPDDAKVGMWVALALQRAAYIAGFRKEIKAVIAESLARGTSVMQIGYHEEVIDLATAREAGKDSQSVAPEVIAAVQASETGQPFDPGAFESKEGQAHDEISEGLGNIAEDPMFQRVAGQAGVRAVLARKGSHDEAAFEEETDEKPISSTRPIRRRWWMRKRRVGEEVGWAPHVFDVDDTPFWWERQTFTVAEVKASDLFTDAFKKVVEGYDGWNVSGVARGGRTASTDNMDSDARQAQTEDVLDDDERIVEVFWVWYRRPDMKAGGVRKAVCAEYPDDFVQADDGNPYVDEKGYGLIEGFYPFYDFTPNKSSLTVPATTCGIPPVAVGMTQFEQISEGLRLVHESALRHSLRLYQISPMQKDAKAILDAIHLGKDGFAFIADAAAVDGSGVMQPVVVPIQFTGNTKEIENYVAMCMSHWVQVMGMPPAVLQGVGTAETLGQDEMGVAAGEQESGSLVTYFEQRFADVLSGGRGIMRGNYDDEDWIAMLGEEGAAALKSWQTGTVDIGDEIEVTFGANAEAQKLARRKQLMEAITLENGDIEPTTGMPKWDTTHLFEELHRSLDVGAPKMNTGMLAQLQNTVIQLAQMVKQLGGPDILGGGQPGQGGGKPPQNGKTQAGPNPSEGDGPTGSNISAGAKHGTLATTTY